ncbi:MAG: winged helix-turn-helix domain-containing protein [Cyanobacteria bacterium J06638_20]
MDHPVIKQITDLPQEDQLEYAIEVIRALVNDDVTVLAQLRAKGISTKPAGILLALGARPGTALTKEQLFNHLYPLDSDAEMKIIDVFVCKLRKILGKDVIETIWGQGYRMTPEKAEEIIPKPLTPRIPVTPPNRNALVKSRDDSRRWTPEEDEQLVEMLLSDESMAMMAHRLRRSERAVSDRRRNLLQRARNTA